MTYSWQLVIKKTGNSSWTLYSEKGVELHEFHRVANAVEAEMLAKAWASSWNSVSIRVEGE